MKPTLCSGTGGGHRKYLLAHQNTLRGIVSTWGIGTSDVRGYQTLSALKPVFEKGGRHPRILGLFLFSLKDQRQSAKKQNL